MRGWKGLDIKSEGEGISEPLSYQVNLLGTLLGQVIREQAGDDVFELVEDLRLRCKKAAGGNDPKILFDVLDTIEKLDLDNIFWLIRSFSTFFHLINEAERQEITRLNREKALAKSPGVPTGDSIMDAVAAIHKDGASEKSFLDILKKLDIQPTLTAHPTEVRRGSLLFKQNRIARLLSRIPFDAELPEEEKDRILTRIYHEIALVMTTEEVRAERLQVEDEVANGLHYCVTSIWETVPLIYRDLNEAAESVYGSPPEDVHPFLRYRSWIGGDRDGNPYVTPAVTRKTLRVHRDAALQEYRKELEELWRELSISSLRVDAPEILKKSIEQDRKNRDMNSRLFQRYRLEPFRLKIFTIIEKMDELLNGADPASYPLDRFLSDLNVLRKALEHIGLGDLGQRGRLADLITRAKIFGFHLAALDIRQHSKVHEKTVEELLKSARAAKDYSLMEEPEKIAILEQELLNARPLVKNSDGLSKAASETLETMEMVRESMNKDPKSIGGYIISMTHEISDMLEVLLIAKESGLWKISEDQVETRIDVAPLFETISDLENAGHFLEKLFQNRIYQMHLLARGNFQEIMLGYSDSNKDGGYWTSNWFLEKALKNISNACLDRRIRFRFFHGRGGSVGRGGGRANQAILSQAPESRNGAIRFTEQGEVISFRYARSAIAHRHLEQIVNAVMLAAHDPTCDSGCDAKMRSLMEKLAGRSMEAYRELIDDPSFWKWYQSATPIEHIGSLPIASRPVSRKPAEETEFEDLRAIPWNFSWTQTRYNIPGWYGIGTAFEDIVQNDSDALALLQRMWEQWPLFHSVLENAQLEMARTRLDIARVYNRRSSQKFHRKIEQEFKRSEKWVLKITGQEILLDNHPIIQKVIGLRNPYTDVLNLVQVELLRRWEAIDENNRGPVRHALFLSINAIAAAMQSTG